MAENQRYTSLYQLPENLYFEKSPIIIKSGKLLKDNQYMNCFINLDIQNIESKNIIYICLDILNLDSEKNIIENINYINDKLNISNNEVEQIYIPLKSSEMKAFNVKIVKIGFNDGSSWENVNNIINYNALKPSFDINSRIKSIDLINKYNNMTNIYAKNLPSSQYDLWQCFCGAINRKPSLKCFACKNDLTFLIEIFNEITKEQDFKPYNENTLSSNESTSIQEENDYTENINSNYQNKDSYGNAGEYAKNDNSYVNNVDYGQNSDSYVNDEDYNRDSDSYINDEDYSQNSDSYENDEDYNQDNDSYVNNDDYNQDNDYYVNDEDYGQNDDYDQEYFDEDDFKKKKSKPIKFIISSICLVLAIATLSVSMYKENEYKDQYLACLDTQAKLKDDIEAKKKALSSEKVFYDQAQLLLKAIIFDKNFRIRHIFLCMRAISLDLRHAANESLKMQAEVDSAIDLLKSIDDPIDLFGIYIPNLDYSYKPLNSLKSAHDSEALDLFNDFFKKSQNVFNGLNDVDLEKLGLDKDKFNKKKKKLQELFESYKAMNEFFSKMPEASYEYVEECKNVFTKLNDKIVEAQNDLYLDE